jgi:hypothetical protein
MKTKVCPGCKVEKACDLFSKDKHKKDGLQTYCKECQKGQSLKYRETHPNYFKEKGREKYKATKHLNKERYQKYRDRYLEFKRRYGNSLPGRFNTLLYSAKTRATKNNLEYNLTLDWLLDEYEKQDGCCALTGVKLEFKSNDDSSRRYQPYSPSLDKIDSSKGYTKDNTRLVCTHINIAMNEFGEDVFESIAKMFLEKKGYKVSGA